MASTQQQIDAMRSKLEPTRNQSINKALKFLITKSDQQKSARTYIGSCSNKNYKTIGLILNFWANI